MRIHITFHRVQRWLFSVPRLKAMIGANILLGELLRIHLRALARQSDQGWQLQSSHQSLPESGSEQTGLIDPLGTEEDTPYRDAEEGIFARDGGHFEAEFTSEAGVFAFSKAAQTLIYQKCPGLDYGIEYRSNNADKQIAIPPIAQQSRLSIELPVFAPCEWSGHDLASKTITQGVDTPRTSLETAQRWEASRSTTSRDLASLILAQTNLAKTPPLEEFKQLAAGGYLAVIHADGNGVGAGNGATGEQERMRHFYRNRVLLRSSLLTAINRVCPGEHLDKRPLQILMLGGDDLLIVCQAHLALPFIITLCRQLQTLQQQHPATHNTNFELTLGIGAIITRPTIPFNRLHELAEMLASSAKRKVRGLPESERYSVVDWAVYTTSLIEEIHIARKRDWICQGTKPRILSRRPLRVLGNGCDSLEGLLEKSHSLTSVPRSQLRFLLDQLGKGEYLSNLAFAELVPTAHQALQELGITQVWEPSDSMLTTSLLDLIETYEIPRLGCTNPASSSSVPAETQLNGIAYAQ